MWRLLDKVISFIYSIDDYTGERIAIFILLLWNLLIAMTIFYYF
jgi:hypothetical protein